MALDGIGSNASTKPIQGPSGPTPENLMQELTEARTRIDGDRFKLEHPGMWQRTKEVFSSSTKNERLQKINESQRMDSILDQLWQMISAIYKAQVNPEAESPSLAPPTASNPAK